MGSEMCIRDRGLDVSATHHRSATEGMLTITATAISLGRTVTSHEVVIEHESGTRLCTMRITNLIVDRPIPGHGPQQNAQPGSAE